MKNNVRALRRERLERLKQPRIGTAAGGVDSNGSINHDVVDGSGPLKNQHYYMG